MGTSSNCLARNHLDAHENVMPREVQPLICAARMENVKFSGLSIVNEVAARWLQSQCTEACLNMFEHVVAITIH